jgi:hypothetical protein
MIITQYTFISFQGENFPFQEIPSVKHAIYHQPKKELVLRNTWRLPDPFERFMSIEGFMLGVELSIYHMIQDLREREIREGEGYLLLGSSSSNRWPWRWEAAMVVVLLIAQC